MKEIASSIDPATTPYVVEVVEKGASSKVMMCGVSAVGWVGVYMYSMLHTSNIRSLNWEIFVVKKLCCKYP